MNKTQRDLPFSPAVSIYVTSVLERCIRRSWIGERCNCGVHANLRMRRRWQFANVMKEQ